MQKISKYLVLDIGGTLNKMCFLSAKDNITIPHIQALTIHMQKISIFFNMFKKIQDCFACIEQYFKNSDQYDTIAVTGGGGYKYDKQLNSFGKKIIIVKQFQSLTKGLSFFKDQNNKEFVLTIFKNNEEDKAHEKENVRISQIKLPALIVNVGSGVSILKVTQKNDNYQCERVGGTSLGGGYFMGLAKLLLNITDFPQLLKMVQKGSSKNIDYVPSDFLNISKQMTQASVLVSLGKLNQNSKKQDIALSLFNMVAFNIAQIALMYSDLSSCQDVIFTGFFCRDNNFVLDCFAQAFHFYQSKQKSQMKRIYSLKHDGYLGTIGTLYSLMKQDQS